MESQNKTLDEVADQVFQHLQPNIKLCRCGSIPKLIGWKDYSPILECEFCRARVKGGDLR